MSALREAKPAPRVLLAGVEEPFGLALAAELRGLGWDVLRTRGGREALSRWDEVRGDVIVTDLDGGDMDAFDFLQALAALPSRPPVLACTRSPAPDDLDRDALRALGVDAVVAGPCRVDAMAAMLERVARRLPARAAAAPEQAEAG